MSRNKVKREKTHKSILAQFFILLVGLGLLCGALFLVLHTTVGSALESYVYSSDFLSKRHRKACERFAGVRHRKPSLLPRTPRPSPNGCAASP